MTVANDADLSAALGDKQTTVGRHRKIDGLVQAVGDALDSQRHAIERRARRSGRPGRFAPVRRRGRLMGRRRGHHGDVQGSGSRAFEHRAAGVGDERRELQRVRSG